MTEGKIWMNGSLVNWDEAKIHILTHSLHYGTGVFEGIRCYKTINGQAVFRLPEHIRRLMDSGKIYLMDLQYSKDQLQGAVIDTIKANEIEECYIRLIAYYGYGKMGVNPLPNKVSVAIALWKWDEYLRGDKQNYGARIMVSSWVRIDGRSMPVHAKATANYANSALARVEALKSGFDEAIMLNANGMVVEASAENIFIVKDNILITPPVTSGALNGITRDSILTLAREKRIPYEIRDIARDELYLADEVFLTGTAAEVKSVVEIDNRTIGDGKTGAITQRLKMLFESVVHGEYKKFSKKWLMFV
ncbi:MAG: branched-chain amino acid transaminase [Thermoproteota archaeon]|nr:branched-chain amino acid transaminase [Thermoproteota archaeon]